MRNISNCIKYIILTMLIGLLIFCCATFVWLIGIFYSNNFKEERHYSISPIDSVIMRKCYFKEFKSGLIKSVFFKKLDVNVNSKNFKELNKVDKQNLLNSYPSYHMEFVVVDNGFLMNFKNVIFNGIDDAKLYDQRDMVYGGFRYSKKAYFQIIGNYDVKLNKMKQYTPAIVVNVFKININDALFNSLLKQKTLKVTLISHNNKEYILQTNNFLSKYNFQTPEKENSSY
ncbi:conserved hypothetical protein (plasmid) [Borreliella burgdorferi 29805]|uniref:hypothetical protein n=2 Tax=Borreliella burgdorferi TaxID=139 RepID=UPI00017F4654|nr:hypothetical protein [Borreliella burgdorferi]ACO38225.1 conserved hypothetical protein [Borreliella burgdorferi 29805]ADQ30011.1 conserved hypothetical protein [Borreliella burgdorferi N40]MCD2373045.1 hypothetical protein [Borreliella burgdorferi]MCD2376868.1 hypothetical protein [Borreliella burgdorferi]MCD2376875.1 hypothetical protein [Borreliella burgdorferi]